MDLSCPTMADFHCELSAKVDNLAGWSHHDKPFGTIGRAHDNITKMNKYARCRLQNNRCGTNQHQFSSPVEPQDGCSTLEFDTTWSEPHSLLQIVALPVTIFC